MFFFSSLFLIFYTTGIVGSWCMRSALTTQLSFISTWSMIRFFHLKYAFYPGIFKMQDLLFASSWIRHPQWLQNCSNPNHWNIEISWEGTYGGLTDVKTLSSVPQTHGTPEKNWFGALKLSVHWDSLVWRSWVNEKGSFCWNRKTVMRIPRDPLG